MKTPHVRKALWIGCSLLIFQQLSGIDTIMYYTGPLIKAAGIQDDHTTIWLSLGTSFVNFFGTVLPFFVIERYGRRRILLVSTALTIFALLLLGTSFLALNRDTNEIVSPKEMHKMLGMRGELDASLEHLEHCLSKRRCDDCTTDDRCGYCGPSHLDVGLCIPLNQHNPDESLTWFCSSAGNSSIFGNTTFEWTDVACETQYTFLPLILIVVYLLCFSLGLSTIPWVLNAEIYPLWARGTCVSIATCAIWSANAFISLTFLTLTSTVSRYGAFYIYAIITMFALLVFYRYVPETSGTSLDEVELLFMSATERSTHLSELHTQIARRQSLRAPDNSSTEISYKILDSGVDTSSVN